jgi:asparagine synthase (glutamine-hydrolysing)
LLRDTDVMSMAHSLEVRVPLLDHRLVQAVLRLPEWVQRNGDGPKALLVDALGPDLPPMIRERRDKMGFSFPFGLWLGRMLWPYVAEKLCELSLRRLEPLFLKPEAILQIKRAYEGGRIHWSRVWAFLIWTLFVQWEG